MLMAARAFPFPYAEIPDGFIPVSAFVTDLAARKPFVDFHEIFVSVFKLVLEKSQKHSVTIVDSRLAVTEPLVGHSPHIQTFHTYYIIPVGYPGR